MEDISKKSPSLLTIDDASFLSSLKIYDLEGSTALISNVTALL